jgi:protein-disulfide isomerase
MWSRIYRNGSTGRKGYNFPMKTLTLCVALVAFAACSSSAQQARRSNPNDVVATVGSAPITLSEVDDKALELPAGNFAGVKLALALYEARRIALEEMIAIRLMDDAAKAAGIDRAALIEKEITSKIQPVNEPDIAAWYQANQARVQGAALDQVRQPIRAYLVQERMQDVRAKYVGELRSKTTVRMMLEPPRQMVAAGNSPAKGPAKAPIEIIEFSDFQCPYCLRVDPTVQQVLGTYGDRIRFVYRHYPLPNHPNARPAAEAAACAEEQDKFWQYHDRLFANPSKLGDPDLKQHAAELGLNTGQFNGCLDSHKLKARVDGDLKAGEEAGVNGTPAFFINGRMLSGAQPFEAFKKIIDEELVLKKG